MVGSCEALELGVKRTIDMGTIMALNIYESWEGAVKPRRNVIDTKVGTEESIIDFLKRYVRGKK